VIVYQNYPMPAPVGVIASTPQFIPYLIPPTVEDRAQLQRVETDEDEGGSIKR
jgi:hypothetical protein